MNDQTMQEVRDAADSMRAERDAARTHTEQALAAASACRAELRAMKEAFLKAWLDGAACAFGLLALGSWAHDVGDRWRCAEIKADGRRAFFADGEPRMTLTELVERARSLPPMTLEQRNEQRASFAYGNLALTREYADASPERLERLRQLCRIAAGCKE